MTENTQPAEQTEHTQPAEQTEHTLSAEKTGKQKGKKKHRIRKIMISLFLLVQALILLLFVTLYLYLHSKFKLMQEDTWTGVGYIEDSGELYGTDGDDPAGTEEPVGGETNGAGEIIGGDIGQGNEAESSGEDLIEPETGGTSGGNTGGTSGAGGNSQGGTSENGGNTGGNAGNGGNSGNSGNSGATQAPTMDPAYAGLETKDAVEATGEVKVDKQVFNILLIGSDEDTDSYSSASRSDTCILMSINTMGDKPVISLVSFQRDMAVLIQEGKYAGTWDKLNHTFQYGGAEQLMRQIEYSFKVDVDYYVRVNFNVFRKGIDYIGGVDVYMDQKEVTYFHDGHISPDVYVGTNHLNGQLALAYARLREIDSDWARIQRQREVIISALNQVKGMSFGEIDGMINTLLPMVRTNLTEWKVAQLMLLIPSIMQAEVQQLSIPVAGTYGLMDGPRWMLSVDFDKNAAVLHQFLYGE